MLRHIGQKRTNVHNIRLAGLLSLTAGFVNGAGFLSFAIFTTNVTGHVAQFAEKLANGELNEALVIGLWMLLFFAGAFVSSIIINATGHNQRYAYTIPIILEMIILLLAATNIHWYDKQSSNFRFTAGSLLFAMGLQNAMVSMISGSVVRTTHLTGMFTDLGIELAGSIYKPADKSIRPHLRGRIFLRLIIIGFFFAGCILSAIIYHSWRSNTFYIPVALLIICLLFDISRIKTMQIYRKVKAKYTDTGLTGHAE